MRAARWLLIAPTLPLLAAGCATNDPGDNFLECVPVICSFVGSPPEPPPPPPAPPPPAPAPAPVAEERIVLRGVNFAFDSAVIEPDSAVILDVVVETLQSRPDIDVRVEGHTDSVGTAAYNQGLSERRAAAVRQYLVEHGISPARLTSVGYGESQPIATNDTREGRALNRRVELKVVR